MTDEAQDPQNADKSTGTTSTPATVTQWYSDDHKDLVTQRGWKQADDVIKSYRELEKSASGKIKIPDDKASPEDRAKFYQKLGCPETVEGYDIKVDESLAPIRNQAIESRLLAKAHERGASKDLMNDLVSEYYSVIAEGMVQAREESMAALRKDLGDNYDEEIKIARRFTQNCSDEFKQFLEDTGIGNNPVVIKEFIGLGKKTLSDSLIKGDPVPDEDKNYKPANPNSPDMYATGEDEESRRARKYFERRGHKY